MKKIVTLFALTAFLFSCEKDEIQVMISGTPTPPAITSPSTGTTTVIEESKLGESIDIEWNKADYGVITQLTYTVEIAEAGSNFETPVALGTTTGVTLSLKLSELNDKLVKTLQVPANEESEIELRVVSKIQGQFAESSSIVTLNITPWKSTEPTMLWVPGGYQGWNPSAAPVIYSTSATTYEGYVYIKEGTGFKFTSAPDWDHINYGDSGTSGKLTTDGLANGLSASEAGFYRFKVDIANLTYEMYRVDSWGIIGTATAGNWDNSTPMTFSATTGLWTYVGELKAGALKFRANNDWGLNYGPENSNLLTGQLIATDGAITISDPGVYTITLDFSRSQNPWMYKYKVMAGTVAPEPTKLWIPGGYQASGGDPSKDDAMIIYAVSGSSDKVYEGYFSFAGPTWIKFTSAADWGHTNYGSGGVNALSTDGAAAGIDVPSAGYFKVVVNIDNLTYSLTKIDSWGLIGNATSGVWDNSTPMDYNPTTKKWSKTVDLVNGALKFRANNGWDINYGPADSNSFDGVLIGTDAAISIIENGNYTVTIDLTRSVAPYKYSYTVVKN